MDRSREEEYIKKAWIEESDDAASKLCVRYSPDTGAENFGNFFPSHRIIPEEFEGLSSRDARRKFIDIVYFGAPTLEQTTTSLSEIVAWGRTNICWPLHENLENALKNGDAGVYEYSIANTQGSFRGRHATAPLPINRAACQCWDNDAIAWTYEEHPDLSGSSQTAYRWFKIPQQQRYTGATTSRSGNSDNTNIKKPEETDNMIGTISAVATIEAITQAKALYEEKYAKLESECIQPTVKEITAFVEKLMYDVPIKDEDRPTRKTLMNTIALSQFDKAIRELNLKYSFSLSDGMIPVSELTFNPDQLLDAHERLHIIETEITVSW